MRVNDAPDKTTPARQLELFGEELDESERAQGEPVVASVRRRRSNAELEVVPTEGPNARAHPGARNAAAERLALTRPSTSRQHVLPRLAVSPDEAAAILGVSRDYLDEHVIGELRVVRRGRRILIALAELERWLDRAATRATVGGSS